jgi:hypothetical protein
MIFMFNFDEKAHPAGAVDIPRTAWIIAAKAEIV